MSELQLGKLETVYAVAPAYVQRAVVVAVASFVCFLAMMAGFYLRQNIGYFLLSTAFLVVYVLTMIGLLMMKRGVVNVYQNGISYRKFTAHWQEIESVGFFADVNKKNHAEIVKKTGEKVVLSDAIENIAQIIETIGEKMENEKAADNRYSER